jgi:hypothetical protein
MSIRVFTIGLSSFVIFALASVATAKEFVDVPQDHAQRISIDYLSELEIFKGQGDGQNFTPDQPVNRAEWAEILLRQSDENIDPTKYRDCFFDVFAQWFAPAICYAAEQGWMKGYQSDAERGFFFPVRVITAGEILVTLDRAFDWSTMEGEFWFSGAMDYAKKANIVSSGIAFDQPLSRADAAEILFRSLALRELKVSRYDPFLGELFAVSEEEPVVIPDQPLPQSATVNLEPFADQPAKATLARGSLYVPVLRFQLEADQNVALQEISVERVSVGKTDDLGLGRLLINGKVLHERNFSNENAIFWTNLNFQMIAGESVIVEMNVDFEETATPTLVYQFEVKPDKILFEEENIRITGEKVTGKAFNVASPLASMIVVKNHSAALKLPFVDSTDQTLGKFQITAGEHDVLIKRIRLEDSGDVSSRDFKNFRLTTGSGVISVLTSIEQNVLDFIVSDYLIEATRTRTFTIMADIAEAGIDDNIRFYIQEPEHIHAFDIEYGFGTRVDNQFNKNTSWCVGSNTPQCPLEGLRKRCSKEDQEWGVKDCEP